jgi:hypothetical protein
LNPALDATRAAQTRIDLEQRAIFKMITAIFCSCLN